MHTGMPVGGVTRRMMAPEYHRRIRIARTQRGRLSVRAASLASQQPIGRGFASPEPIDASGWPHAILRIATKIRATINAGSARRAAGPDIPQGARRWDSEARSEAAGGSRAARADGTDEWV